MHNPSVLHRCTAQKSSGAFCDMPSLVDAPFPICAHHAKQIFDHYDANALAKTRSLVSALRKSTSEASYAARQETRKRAAAEQSVVYYVRIGDHVKIGTTTNLRARLIGLRVDPEALLATEPGSYELERERHTQFSSERMGRRENFNPSRRLLAHIDSILAEHGDPVITTYVPASA